MANSTTLPTSFSQLPASSSGSLLTATNLEACSIVLSYKPKLSTLQEEFLIGEHPKCLQGTCKPAQLPTEEPTKVSTNELNERL